MKIIKNEYDGMYAVPLSHPITCINPAPWKIAEMRIEQRGVSECIVMIRGDGSCWFRADQCFCDASVDECLDYMKFKKLN